MAPHLSCILFYAPINAHSLCTAEPVYFDGDVPTRQVQTHYEVVNKITEKLSQKCTKIEDYSFLNGCIVATLVQKPEEGLFRVVGLEDVPLAPGDLSEETSEDGYVDKLANSLSNLSPSVVGPLCSTHEIDSLFLHKSHYGLVYSNPKLTVPGVKALVLAAAISKIIKKRVLEGFELVSTLNEVFSQVELTVVFKYCEICESYSRI